ncbi:MAG: tetratricopeptide repeat protein [Planctomycetaceae bacterium]|nr:tetratricopeptide repeat protein [Planctomycetaceae bacterium]
MWAALQVEPESGDARGLEAFCLLEIGDHQGARTSAGRCVSLEPTRAWNHYVLGRVLRLSGDREGARVPLDEAIRLDPEEPDYRQERAWFRFDGEWYSGALADAEEGLRIDPLHGPCASVRGITLQHLGRFEEAEAAYREALRLDPEMPIPHAGLGFLALRKRQGVASVEAFRTALRLDPAYGWVKSGLPDALLLCFPGYARIDRILQVLRDLAAWKRTGIAIFLLVVLGGWSIVIVILTMESSHRSMSAAKWVGMLLLPFLAWTWTSVVWVARPLYELALGFHPVGKWLVRPSRRRHAYLVAGCLASSLLLLCGGLLGAGPLVVWVGSSLLVLLPSLGALGRGNSPGWLSIEGISWMAALSLVVLSATVPGEGAAFAVGVAMGLAFLLAVNAHYLSFTDA